MTRHQHPSETTLAELVAGQLDAGSALVVAAHLEGCPACRRHVRELEEVGGALLETLESTPMEPSALANTLARLPAQSSAGERRDAQARTFLEPGLPAALAGHALGPWRWKGPGVYQRDVLLPESATAARVFLLKAAPGIRLPHHTHTGIERTQVLAGAFSHDGGRFGAGAFDDAEGDIEHRPTVDAGEPCLCLVAMTGTIRLTGSLGRLIQPFIRL